MKETVRVLELMDHVWLAENFQLVQEKEEEEEEKKTRLGNNVKLLMSGHKPYAVFSNNRERYFIFVFFSHSSSIFRPPFFLLCIGLPVNVSTTILPNLIASLFILNYIIHKVGKLTVAWLLKKSCILCGIWRFITAFTWAHYFVLWDHNPWVVWHV